MIKFIYFDLGGVVFHFSGGLEKLAKRFDRTYEDFREVFNSLDNHVCRGEVSPSELWKIYCERLDLPNDAISHFAEYWVSNFVPIEETGELIIRLSKEYQLGLLTNIYPDIFPMLLQQNLIPQINWLAIVLSCQEGFVKPEKELYVIATERAHFHPSEILFIDDKQDFLDGAKKVGWNTFKFEELDPQSSVESIRNLLRLD